MKNAGIKKSRGPKFPFNKINEFECETEEDTRQLVDQFVAKGGTGEMLMAQLNEALAEMPTLAVVFNHEYQPIIDLIPDFSSCRAAAVAYAVNSSACCVLPVLLERGADCYLPDEKGCPPLVVAAMHEDAVMALSYVEDLLEFGIDPDCASEDGRTALMSAAAFGHIGVVEGLLGSGADVNRVDAQGRTALHYAMLQVGMDSGDRLECAKRLLEAGARVDARTITRDTPLHLLVGAGGLSSRLAQPMVDLLLAHGADIEARNLGQFTPILEAASRSGLDGSLVKKLHDCGANMDAKVFGRVLIDEVAEGEGAKRVVRAIRMGQRIERAMSDDCEAVVESKRSKTDPSML